MVSGVQKVQVQHVHTVDEFLPVPSLKVLSKVSQSTPKESEVVHS